MSPMQDDEQKLKIELLSRRTWAWGFRQAPTYRQSSTTYPAHVVSHPAKEFYTDKFLPLSGSRSWEPISHQTDRVIVQKFLDYPIRNTERVEALNNIEYVAKID